MDLLLGKVTQHAMNYAIRSGITITTTYAIKQCSRLLKEAPRGKKGEELMRLQLRLESKIRIISPAIDMIELISARGNTSLESAVSLTKEIRYEMQKLGTRLSNAANEEELLRRRSNRAKSREETDAELDAIISSVKMLLVRIEDAVPLINLAITTSGVNLSTNLSGTVSPSRLLQASTFLTAADTKYAAQPGSSCQVGPTYMLSLYMLFAGHMRPTDEASVRDTTWKEVIHKARVKLVRVALDRLYDLPGQFSTLNGPTHNSMPADATSAEFAYQLVVIEDLDDDRVHTFEENEAQPAPFDGVASAGIRFVVPIHQVSKVFYADTGKILNIGGDGDANSPVLLLKRDVHAEPPRNMLRRSQMGVSYNYFESPRPNGVPQDMQSEVDAQFDRESAPNTPARDPQVRSSAWRLPADLDPEWMAFEVYAEDTDSESDSDDLEFERSSPNTKQAGRPLSNSRQPSLEPALTSALSKLQLSSASRAGSPRSNSQLVPSQSSSLQQPAPARPAALSLAIKTSLSLLEMLLKLTALQQFRQTSHLAIEDELLNFFLEDSATAGAGPDKDYRQRLRHAAVRRVGFDPYDESPIKRRGEAYISHARGNASPRPTFDAEAEDAFVMQQFPYDDSYGYDDDDESPAVLRPSIQQPFPLRDTAPSSPSPVGPMPMLLQQTPSRSSTPGEISERHRNAVQAKYSGGGANGAAAAEMRSGSQVSLLATPPRSSRSKQVLRALSEPKAGSPLVREFREEGREDDVVGQARGGHGTARIEG